MDYESDSDDNVYETIVELFPKYDPAPTDRADEDLIEGCVKVTPFLPAYDCPPIDVADEPREVEIPEHLKDDAYRKAVRYFEEVDTDDDHIVVGFGGKGREFEILGGETHNEHLANYFNSPVFDPESDSENNIDIADSHLLASAYRNPLVEKSDSDDSLDELIMMTDPHLDVSAYMPAPDDNEDDEVVPALTSAPPYPSIYSKAPLDNTEELWIDEVSESKIAIPTLPIYQHAPVDDTHELWKESVQISKEIIPAHLQGYHNPPVDTESEAEPVFAVGVAEETSIHLKNYLSPPVDTIDETIMSIDTTPEHLRHSAYLRSPVDASADPLDVLKVLTDTHLLNDTFCRAPGYESESEDAYDEIEIADASHLITALYKTPPVDTADELPDTTSDYGTASAGETTYTNDDFDKPQVSPSKISKATHLENSNYYSPPADYEYDSDDDLEEPAVMSAVEIIYAVPYLDVPGYLSDTMEELAAIEMAEELVQPQWGDNNVDWNGESVYENNPAAMLAAADVGETLGLATPAHTNTPSTNLVSDTASFLREAAIKTRRKSLEDSALKSENDALRAQLEAQMLSNENAILQAQLEAALEGNILPDILSPGKSDALLSPRRSETSHSSQLWSPDQGLSEEEPARLNSSFTTNIMDKRPANAHFRESGSIKAKREKLVSDVTIEDGKMAMSTPLRSTVDTGLAMHSGSLGNVPEADIGNEEDIYENDTEAFTLSADYSINATSADGSAAANIEQLNELSVDALRSIIVLTVDNSEHGSVSWSGNTDISGGMDFKKLVRITPGIVEVDASHWKRGEGLNKHATVTLRNIFQNNSDTSKGKTPADFRAKLVRNNVKTGATFVGYGEEDGLAAGEWRFTVEHFSKYGLLDDSDSDIEDGEVNAISKL